MELRLDSRPPQKALDQATEVLRDRRLVVVFGDRLTLISFALMEPVRSPLLAAATTEDEGFELVLRTQPDLLICSSDLETGYGINLLRRVKLELPTCQLLIVLARETQASVQEAPPEVRQAASEARTPASWPAPRRSPASSLHLQG